MMLGGWGVRTTTKIVICGDLFEYLGPQWMNDIWWFSLFYSCHEGGHGLNWNVCFVSAGAREKNLPVVVGRRKELIDPHPFPLVFSFIDLINGILVNKIGVWHEGWRRITWYVRSKQERKGGGGLLWCQGCAISCWPHQDVLQQINQRLEIFEDR